MSFRLGPVACSNSEVTSETMNPFRYFGWEISPLQGLYLHVTAWYRKMLTFIHHWHVNSWICIFTKRFDVNVQAPGYFVHKVARAQSVHLMQLMHDTLHSPSDILFGITYCYQIFFMHTVYTARTKSHSWEVTGGTERKP